jgi:UDP-GlcNAc:undecaprenyl-phosphate/decaprenyl-phosphate GlcNAc-1-phosphate transferase
MIVAILFTFFLTFFGLLILLRSPLKQLAIDQPNERSLHSKATPRTGGLALMAGTLITWLFSGVSWYWILLSAALIAVSLVDDMRGLAVRWRLLIQLLVCMIFLAMHPENITWWIILPLLLAMVWTINFYNFMDGSDGLAGGMAFFGFGAYALAAWLSDDIHLALMCAAVASASLAFLLFNFHPAKIFMGDSGSVPIGFLVATIGLFGWQRDLWPAWFPLLVFSPFIVDATVTLLKRLVRNEKFWEAHKSHYYQHLIQIGWGHRKTAIVEYGLMLAVAASAILLLKQGITLTSIVLAVWVLFYLVVMCAIDKRWSVSKRSNDAF